MIYLNFTLNNPFNNKFVDLGSSYIPVSKYKAFEFQHMFHSGTIAEFEFRATTRQDHAGVALTIGLFGYSVCVEFCDSRHWNYKTNSWEKYDEG